VIEKKEERDLEEETRLLCLSCWLAVGEEDDLEGLVKHVLEAPLCQAGALHVLDGLDLLGQSLALGHRKGLLSLFPELCDRLWVVSEVDLGPDEDDAGCGAVVLHFRPPLGADVLVRCGVRDAVADEENVRLRIAQRTETVIVLLSGSVPKTEGDGLAVHHHVRCVVVENGRNVCRGERVARVADKHAGLADGTITHNNKFDALDHV